MHPVVLRHTVVLKLLSRIFTLNLCILYSYRTSTNCCTHVHTTYIHTYIHTLHTYIHVPLRDSCLHVRYPDTVMYFMREMHRVELLEYYLVRCITVVLEEYLSKSESPGTTGPCRCFTGNRTRRADGRVSAGSASRLDPAHRPASACRAGRRPPPPRRRRLRASTRLA